MVKETNSGQKAIRYLVSAGYSLLRKILLKNNKGENWDQGNHWVLTGVHFNQSSVWTGLTVYGHIQYLTETSFLTV